MEHLSKPINPAKKVKKHIYLSSIYIQHHKLFLLHMVFQTSYCMGCTKPGTQLTEREYINTYTVCLL